MADEEGEEVIVARKRALFKLIETLETVLPKFSLATSAEEYKMVSLEFIETVSPLRHPDVLIGVDDDCIEFLSVWLFKILSFLDPENGSDPVVKEKAMKEFQSIAEDCKNLLLTETTFQKVLLEQMEHFLAMYAASPNLQTVKTAHEVFEVIASIVSTANRFIKKTDAELLKNSTLGRLIASVKMLWKKTVEPIIKQDSEMGLLTIPFCEALEQLYRIVQLQLTLATALEAHANTDLQVDAFGGLDASVAGVLEIYSRICNIRDQYVKKYLEVENKASSDCERIVSSEIPKSLRKRIQFENKKLLGIQEKLIELLKYWVFHCNRKTVDKITKQILGTIPDEFSRDTVYWDSLNVVTIIIHRFGLKINAVSGVFNAVGSIYCSLVSTKQERKKEDWMTYFEFIKEFVEKLYCFDSIFQMVKVEQKLNYFLTILRDGAMNPDFDISLLALQILAELLRKFEKHILKTKPYFYTDEIFKMLALCTMKIASKIMNSLDEARLQALSKILYIVVGIGQTGIRRTDFLEPPIGPVTVHLSWKIWARFILQSFQKPSIVGAKHAAIMLVKGFGLGLEIYTAFVKEFLVQFKFLQEEGEEIDNGMDNENGNNNIVRGLFLEDIQCAKQSHLHNIMVNSFPTLLKSETPDTLDLQSLDLDLD